MIYANEKLFAKVAKFTQLKEEEGRKEKQSIDLVAVFVVLFRSEVDLAVLSVFAHFSRGECWKMAILYCC